MASFQVDQQPNHKNHREQVRWLAGVNMTNDGDELGGPIPAYAICHLSLAVAVGGQQVYRLLRPSGINAASLINPAFFAVNGPRVIPAAKGNRKGYGAVTQDWPAQVLCDVTKNDVGRLDTVGPINKSWAVSSEGSGFGVVSLDANRPDTFTVDGKKMRLVWIAPKNLAREATISGIYTTVELAAPGSFFPTILVEPGDVLPTVSEAYGYDVAELGGSSAWNWDGNKLVALRNTVAFVSVSATVSSADAPDGALLDMRLYREFPDGSSALLSPAVHGGRKQSFTFRTPDDDGDYFPEFYTSENVSFSGVVRLNKDSTYCVRNASAYAILVRLFTMSVFEIPQFIPESRQQQSST